MLDLIQRFVYPVSRSIKVALCLHKTKWLGFVADDSLSMDGSDTVRHPRWILRTRLVHHSKGRTTNSVRIFLASTSEQSMS
jgi:hypothetical protein